MCNPTMQPPRREMYTLEQTLTCDSENSTADKGGFFMPKRHPRIGSSEWLHERENAIAVFNAGYDVDGTPLDIGNNEPWTVITPDGEWHHFWTHAEALQWVLQEARK